MIEIIQFFLIFSEYSKLNCVIHEVRISPCTKDPKTKACILRKGSEYILEMDFTPDFDGSNVNVMAHAIDYADAPFADMNGDACIMNYLKCPITKGERTTYTYNLTLGKMYPPGVHRVKWVVSEDNIPKCCFTNKLKIDRKRALQ